LTQSERYLLPRDDLVTDEKVQAKFVAEKKRDRVRKTKIKQDKIIDGMRHREMVKDWKDETRKLQQKKLQERRVKGYIGELNLLAVSSSMISTDHRFW